MEERSEYFNSRHLLSFCAFLNYATNPFNQPACMHHHFTDNDYNLLPYISTYVYISQQPQLHNFMHIHTSLNHSVPHPCMDSLPFPQGSCTKHNPCKELLRSRPALMTSLGLIYLSIISTQTCIHCQEGVSKAEILAVALLLSFTFH